jgi:hypothetical protein
MSTFPTFSREVEWEMEEDVLDSTIKSGYESGYVHTRPRFSSDRRVWTNVVYKYLTVSEKDILKAFMATVRMSADIFSWTNPDDGVTYNVRFSPIPKIVAMATGHYYQATMGFEQVR